MLAGLFPGRIDLGIGRAVRHRPADDVRAAARPPAGGGGRLPRAARRAARLPRRDDPGRPPLRAPAAARREERPGRVAARLVAAVGDLGRAARPRLRLRRLHQPAAAPRWASPSAPRAVAVWALAAPTEDEAQHLASSSRMTPARAAPRQPDPGAAAARRPEHTSSDVPRAQRPAGAARSSARRSRCAPGLEEVADAYGADEVIVVTITHDHAARVRSYELIAEACGTVSQSCYKVRRAAIFAGAPEVGTCRAMANRHDRSATVTDHALPQPTGVPLPLRYFDCVLVLAFLPFALLAGLPTLGAVAGVGVWIVAARARRRDRGLRGPRSEDFRRADCG